MATSVSLQFRTRHLIRVIVVWLGLLPMLAATGVAAAPATRVPEALTLDVPAMALTVDDYPIDDLEYEPGVLWGIDEQAMVLGEKLGLDADETREMLGDLGWRGRYVAPISIVNDEDPELADIYGASSITEYATKKGASDGYELPSLEDGTSFAEIDAPPVGDRSRLVAIIHNHRNERSWYGLSYTFQHERIVATVTIAWFDDAGYEPLDAAAMAETAAGLLQRIETVLSSDETPLYLMNLRPAPDATIPQGWREEFFRVQDGISQPMWDLPTADRRAARRTAERYGVIDEYLAQSFFTATAGTGDSLTAGAVVATILTFGSERDAGNYVEDIVSITIDHPGIYEQVEELDDLPGYDDASSGFSYDVPYGGNDMARGYRIYVQIDRTVISIELDSLDGVAISDVYTLVDAQMACVTEFSGEMCAPVPVARMIFDR